MSQLSRKRLQKLLADAGIGSRRSIERLIADGRVTVNSEVAKLGSKASCRDRISVGGQTLHLSELSRHEVLIYHKPLGVVVSRSDPQGRRTVFDNLPKLQCGRWISIGRLDINTSGLLLLCTDGQLAHRWMHPSSQIERTYLVRVCGAVSAAIANRLRAGVELEDGKARFKKLSVCSPTASGKPWLKVVVDEGRNRLIRRLWHSQGLSVTRLIRVAFGRVVLPDDLPIGAYRAMTQSELKSFNLSSALSA